MHQIANKLTPQEKQEFATQERIVKAGRDTFIAVGNALATIRDEKLYREQHGTFEEYCDKRWQMSGRHAERMMNASSSVAVLQSAGATELPASESAARPLAALPDEQKAEAWEAATEAAGDEPPTAKQVAAAVEQVKAATPPKPKKPAPPRLPSIDEHEYDESMRRLVKVLGKGIKSAIEGGTLPRVDQKSVLAWSKQSDEMIPKIQRLVAGGMRWSVKESIHFLQEMPDGKHRIERLCWLADAEDGWEGDINGVHFSLTVNRRRK